MKCIKCKKENELIEIMGILCFYCCNEYNFDLNSLRPRVRESMLEEDRVWRKLNQELSKTCPTSVQRLGGK